MSLGLEELIISPFTKNFFLERDNDVYAQCLQEICKGFTDAGTDLSDMNPFVLYGYEKLYLSGPKLYCH